MYPFSRTLHIAVIGTPSSGKSYLLYDLIHAFHLLGFVAKELPLSYPHSSFGAYFYDAFSAQTGGLRGTNPYICRPENHYGAHLASGKMLNLPIKLKLDFLNIPGEAFMIKQGYGQGGETSTIEKFFELKSAIEQCEENGEIFYLSQWKSPAGHIRNLIVPKGRVVKARHGNVLSLFQRYGGWLQWNELEFELGAGMYEHVKNKSINGPYILNHLPETDIDSFIRSIKEQWSQLLSVGGKRMEEFEEVFKYFYPLVYCQNASDIIVCDRLTKDSNGGLLSEMVCDYMNRLGSRRPHVYLAFREADIILKSLGTDVMETKSNDLYARFLNNILTVSKGRAYLRPEVNNEIKERIKRCIGNGDDSFWLLLRASYGNKQLEQLSQATDYVVPPHVYFTATPVDAKGLIYENDNPDKTRFIHHSKGKRKSFVNEVCEDMSRHCCFGSLQMLIDILLQNGIKTDWQTKKSFVSYIKYFQGKTI